MSECLYNSIVNKFVIESDSKEILNVLGKYLNNEC